MGDVITLIKARNEIDELLFDILSIDDLLGLKADPFTRLETSYVRAIAEVFDNQVNGFTDETSRIFTSLGAAPVTDRAFEAVKGVLHEQMGPELNRISEAEIREKVDKIWQFGKQEPLPIGLALTLGLKDQQAIEWLGNQDHFYVGKIFPSFEKDYVKYLKDLSFEQGLGATEVAKRIKSDVGATLGNRLFEYERVVRTSSTRIRNWSRIYSYDELGVVEVEIVAMLDERSCEICKDLDGKTFTVKDVIDHIEKVIAAPVDQLPALNPFPTPDQAKLDPEVLIAKHGISLPPYHCNCRCLHDITSAEVIPLGVEKTSLSAGDINKIPQKQYNQLVRAYANCVGRM